MHLAGEIIGWSLATICLLYLIDAWIDMLFNVSFVRSIKNKFGLL